jgi:hypothetical protein
MARRTLALIAVSLLLGCGLEGPVPSDKKDAGGGMGTSATTNGAANNSTQTPLGWSPNPELLDKLADPELEQVRRVYHLRPPVGWKFGHKGEGGESLGNRFTGSWQSPKTGCLLNLIIVEPRSGGTVEDTNLDKYFLSHTESGQTTIVQRDPPEKGRIGGLEFTRYRVTTSTKRWDPSGGRDPGYAPLVVRFVDYIAKDGNRLIEIGTGVPVTDNTGWGEDSRLAENAILTLTK